MIYHETSFSEATESMFLMICGLLKLYVSVSQKIKLKIKTLGY